MGMKYGPLHYMFQKYFSQIQCQPHNAVIYFASSLSTVSSLIFMLCLCREGTVWQYLTSINIIACSVCGLMTLFHCHRRINSTLYGLCFHPCESPLPWAKKILGPREGSACGIQQACYTLCCGHRLCLSSPGALLSHQEAPAGAVLRCPYCQQGTQKLYLIEGSSPGAYYDAPPYDKPQPPSSTTRQRFTHRWPKLGMISTIPSMSFTCP